MAECKNKQGSFLNSYEWVPRLSELEGSVNSDNDSIDYPGEAVYTN